MRNQTDITILIVNTNIGWPNLISNSNGLKVGYAIFLINTFCYTG